MINRLKCVLLKMCLLAAWLLKKGAAAPLQSTLDDVERCDWLTEISLCIRVESDDTCHRSTHPRKVMSIIMARGD